MNLWKNSWPAIKWSNINMDFCRWNILKTRRSIQSYSKYLRNRSLLKTKYSQFVTFDRFRYWNSSVFIVNIFQLEWVGYNLYSSEALENVEGFLELIIVLKNNKPKSHVSFFSDSSRLQSILFENNDVPELPLTLLRKTTFNKIIISDQSQVRIIPENFANETEHLKIFQCTKCNILKVEEGAFNNLNLLENLNLQHNSIKDLPTKTFIPLVNLKKLNLKGNQIENFNVDLGKNSNLEIIDISNNPLKDLHLGELIKAVPNLKKLDIRGTKLPKAQLKELITKLTNVEILAD